MTQQDPDALWTDPNERVPLTRADLENAIAWARGEAKFPELAPFSYNQQFWCSACAERNGCGTAFCLHGAGHYLKFGKETPTGPISGDYADCESGYVVRRMLRNGAVTLDEIEASLDWTGAQYDEWYEEFQHRHGRSDV